MRSLRLVTIILLSLLLFLSLNILGIGLLLNSTTLNPDFFTAELDKLNISALTQDIFAESADQEALGEALPNLVASAVAKVER